MSGIKKAPIPAFRTLSERNSEASKQKMRSPITKTLRKHLMKIGNACGKSV
jgi:hypothetical protein